MKPKNCIHRSFWQIYKIINFNLKFYNKKWKKFICESCWEKCKLEWKGYKKLQKGWIKKYIIYFLWILPAIILIYLAVTQIITYICAILIITIFHFLAMSYIINSGRLKISIKK